MRYYSHTLKAAIEEKINTEDDGYEYHIIEKNNVLIEVCKKEGNYNVLGTRLVDQDLINETIKELEAV